MNAEFSIKTAEFEGPLDLLLDLIERRKMHISNVSLAQVTDDYIGFIKQFEHAPMGSMANFILVASTLILIKSLSLLPTLSLTEEEQTSIEELEHRLKLNKLFKDLAEHIKQKFGKKIIFFRGELKNTEPKFTPTGEITKENLLGAVSNVIATLPKTEVVPRAIVKKVISLEEVIGSLTKRIQSSLRMKFSDAVGANKADRVSVIVTFLGMLELVKQGIIEVKQEAHFSEIDMETREVGVPRIS